MAWIITKTFATAALIVLISEVAMRSEKLGAFITALPWVVLLALVWMHVEQQPADKIGSYASYTFWYVLPTLPMFLVLPPLLARWGFWPAFAAGILITAVCFGATAIILQRFGIELL